jgi:hypothetical protein
MGQTVGDRSGVTQIAIQHLAVHDHHLEIGYSADQFRFATQVFYHDVSLHGLRSRYPQTLIDTLTAHIALFEGMKLCSLFPATYDVSPIAEHLYPETLDLFAQIYAGVFAQHWYENRVTNYRGPELIFPGKTLGKSTAIAINSDLDSGHLPTILTGCGGGKDSVLAMKLLESAEIPFATLQYSHSIYGKADTQHQLIADVLTCTKPTQSHRISIYDNFLDNPFFPLYFPKNSGITAPETPVSVFESLLLALQWNYRYLNLSHEKSANKGNLFWEAIGQEVNHQWGKSFEAETLLNQFIQTHFINNFTYFSLLQPLYDLRIFASLSRYPEVVPKIHSCNIQKPWCKKCPKCAYVWLGLMAVFPTHLVDSVFQSNLFDDPDLSLIFRQMIGLEAHTPFECIGEVDESRLNMKRCLEKGMTGTALEVFKTEVLSDEEIDWGAIATKYNHVYTEPCGIPDWVMQRVSM